MEPSRGYIWNVGLIYSRKGGTKRKRNTEGKITVNLYLYLEIRENVIESSVDASVAST